MPLATTLAGSSARGFGGLKTFSLLGTIGQGGGIVFYDAGSVLSWGRFVEVATSSTSPGWTDQEAQWSGNTTSVVSGATNTSIGYGMANTLAIVANNSTANRAATLCRNYSGGGYTSSSNGWFLGTIGEMGALSSNRLYVQSGSWNENYYWTSSNHPSSGGTAWRIDINTGSDPTGSKSNLSWVRPIRAYS